MTGISSMAGYADLLHAYENRVAGADRARAAGMQVVGVVGPTVPTELIWAASCFPLTLSGLPSDTSATDHLMEDFFEPECRYIFDGLMRGAFGELALVIVPRTSDQYNKLYLYLREAARIGQGDRLPPIALYDLLHTRTERSRRYGLARTVELRNHLAAVTGSRIANAELGRAIARSNAVREAMSCLADNRALRPSSVVGSQALVALSAYRFMEREHYIAALAAFCAARKEPSDQGPRVMIKGFPLNHPALHLALERAGAVVVSEDDWWGARAFAAPISEDGDPIEAIFSKYFMDTPGPRIDPPIERERWFGGELVRARIDGVVFYIPPYDDLSGWDVPANRARLDQLGIACTVVRHDAAAPAAASELAAQLADFVNGLPVRTVERRNG
jgi:benzoyl-CoA reductase/2-hydroxyglutaryl-CoA dehydratase subunit BcrC/BadD/HgdB